MTPQNQDPPPRVPLSLPRRPFIPLVVRAVGLSSLRRLPIRLCHCRGFRAREVSSTATRAFSASVCHTHALISHVGGYDFGVTVLQPAFTAAPIDAFVRETLSRLLRKEIFEFFFLPRSLPWRSSCKAEERSEDSWTGRLSIQTLVLWSDVVQRPSGSCNCSTCARINRSPP